ncbi:MFS transporter [Flammeovirgaceae bacterium SG7u.111]|nr:MFS transporter [Flammeovirgaceae bacterium SG7u.132]WPO33014.1 MFS transporter [Flammeovirgaceae bacterium SG7u.111]
MNNEVKVESIAIAKNQPKIINAWCSYDWANSVYALTISSAIFPVYYNSTTRAAFGGDKIQFFGFPIENTVLYSYALSFSFLIIVFLSPILSGMADYGGMKKRMMKFFTALGSASCIALYFFNGHNVEFGIIATILASTGWAGALVFYNAYLPEVATEDRFDSISARGYAMGYVGSVLQLIFSLMIIMNHEYLGITEAFGSKLAFLTVGAWWFLFAQISFHYLPSNVHQRPPKRTNLFKKGYGELKKVYFLVKKMPEIKRFLRSFFFYNAGVQTVMLLAATFGEKEMSLTVDQLITTVLLIQIVAIAGAYLFAQISAWKGNKFSIAVMVIIWVGVCAYAYLMQTVLDFYILAFVIGLIMGGIQSMSRSTYSKLIPRDTYDTASFFSFFDVAEKLSIVMGTFLYGLIEQITGNMRLSALSLVVLFVIGFILLMRFKMPERE